MHDKPLNSSNQLTTYGGLTRCSSVIRSRHLSRNKRTAIIKEKPTPLEVEAQKEMLNHTSQSDTDKFDRSLLSAHITPSLTIPAILQEHCKPLTPSPYFPSQNLSLFSDFMIVCLLRLVSHLWFSLIDANSSISLLPPSFLPCQGAP